LSAYGQPIIELAYTADSRHIIYTPTVAGGRRFEFWRVSVDGGEPQKLGLTMEGLFPSGASMHPDGRRIAFTAGTPPRSEVWVLKDFLPAVKTGKQ
jgi:Tol biopolymer transport system component